jgi:hypothetical protein
LCACGNPARHMRAIGVRLGSPDEPSGADFSELGRAGAPLSCVE